MFVRVGGYIVNLSDFYSYRLIGKLTAFLQLQEFSFLSLYSYYKQRERLRHRIDFCQFAGQVSSSHSQYKIGNPIDKNPLLSTINKNAY